MTKMPKILIQRKKYRKKGYNLSALAVGDNKWNNI